MRLLLFSLLAVASCADATRTAPIPEAVGIIPYQLDAPDGAIALAAELQEISALTMLPSGHLGAVQDEEGTLYEIEPESGAILDRLVFDGAGDFEGVEWAGDAVWALRSDGDLYRLARDSTGTPTVQTLETPQRGRNDTEGLAYDAANHRLLIACKEWPGPGLDDVRAIYAFDLATETMSARPVMLLARADVDGDDNFRPSALAIHPTSGHLYVLSSVRRAIAVLTPDGDLVGVVDLPGDVTPQPEGLAFGPDGTMYLSSEGTVGSGTLLRFAPTQ